MASKCFKEIVNARLVEFKSAFSAAKNIYVDKNGKMIHSGEYGIARENITKALLNTFLPRQYKVDSGFIITKEDNISTQCDIIIYAADYTPKIHSYNEQKFFPIETVLAIGECKSDIQNKNDLKEALIKLSSNKLLRKDTNLDPLKKLIDSQPSVEKHYLDQIFSFLICNDIKFNTNDLNLIDLYDDEIEPWSYHNCVLNIKQGGYLYKNGKSNGSVPIDPQTEKINKVHFVPSTSTEDKDPHIIHFLHYLQGFVTWGTIFNPDMSLYYTNNIS
tara:strand:- start:2792 stop:3613 length:822 start_codon:yes stop_codon:yes gene_type:complete